MLLGGLYYIILYSIGYIYIIILPSIISYIVCALLGAKGVITGVGAAVLGGGRREL